jgi:hypothetical protein
VEAQIAGISKPVIDLAEVFFGRRSLSRRLVKVFLRAEKRACDVECFGASASSREVSRAFSRPFGVRLGAQVWVGFFRKLDANPG